MLDLTTALKTPLYEIKTMDGEVLELKRPTQALQETILSLGGSNIENLDDDASIHIMMEIFVRILNRNTAGRVFTFEEVSEEYDVVIAIVVINDYFAYWNKEIAENVNFLVSQ